MYSQIYNLKILFMFIILSILSIMMMGGWLMNAGFNTIGGDELNAFMRGEKMLPARSFVITFDDGRKDSYYPVDPLLDVLGYKALVFVITKFAFADRSNYYL